MIRSSIYLNWKCTLFRSQMNLFGFIMYYTVFPPILLVLKSWLGNGWSCWLYLILLLELSPSGEMHQREMSRWLIRVEPRHSLQKIQKLLYSVDHQNISWIVENVSWISWNHHQMRVCKHTVTHGDKRVQQKLQLWLWGIYSGKYFYLWLPKQKLIFCFSTVMGEVKGNVFLYRMVKIFRVENWDTDHKKKEIPYIISLYKSALVVVLFLFSCISRIILLAIRIVSESFLTVWTTCPFLFSSKWCSTASVNGVSE